ncbi:hypothetical protein I551_0034 [Mycobacterium ulcerans str. Harvey]|uniref:Uncharacterized protein n=1 Tax=Mycobacterium ulcerans str. Harvey TaxID=1299332 RepID=A0ABP3AQZ3_MYCUL|nr:hypothetical protein I551_0034 [Mycobacterium ulcerans str. Harvey]
MAPGVPGGTIPVRLIDDDLANSLASGAGWIPCSPPPNWPPAATSTRRAPSPALSVWPWTPTCSSPSTR